MFDTTLCGRLVIITATAQRKLLSRLLSLCLTTVVIGGPVYIESFGVGPTSLARGQENAAFSAAIVDKTNCRPNLWFP